MHYWQTGSSEDAAERLLLSKAEAIRFVMVQGVTRDAAIKQVRSSSALSEKAFAKVLAKLEALELEQP